MLINMTVNDLDEVLTLEKDLFHSPWKKEDFLFELTQNPFAVYKIIKEKDKIIGYIGYWLKEPYVEIVNVGVAKEYQRQGYGKQLLENCISDSLSHGGNIFTLEVRTGNQPAIALYQSMGFKQVSIRKNYYRDTNEDAYLMMKEV